MLLLDLPLVAGTEPHEQLRIAARAKPWKSQAVYCSPESTGFSLRGQIHEKATMGELVSELPASGVEGRMGTAHAPEVRLYDGELQSVSMAQLMNGANAAAVLSASGSWEVLQFQHAEEAAVDLWRLSGLLRGQMGTGDAARMGASAGAPFVLLNEAVVPVGLRPEEIGLRLNWGVGPVGQDFSGAHFTSVAGEGGLRALTPLSPVHLRVWMEAGDLHLSWTRRGRMDADSWLGEHIPLGEEKERYVVDVYDESGREFMRHVNTIEPRWVYPGADLIGDFGEVPAALLIKVRQVSGSVGPGVALRRMVRLS